MGIKAFEGKRGWGEWGSYSIFDSEIDQRILEVSSYGNIEGVEVSPDGQLGFIKTIKIVFKIDDIGKTRRPFFRDRDL
jgi:hypothetical protein